MRQGLTGAVDTSAVVFAARRCLVEAGGPSSFGPGAAVILGDRTTNRRSEGEKAAPSQRLGWLEAAAPTFVVGTRDFVVSPWLAGGGGGI